MNAFQKQRYDTNSAYRRKEGKGMAVKGIIAAIVVVIAAVAAAVVKRK